MHKIIVKEHKHNFFICKSRTVDLPVMVAFKRLNTVRNR